MDHRGQLSPDLMIVGSNILLNYVFYGFLLFHYKLQLQIAAANSWVHYWGCKPSGVAATVVSSTMVCVCHYVYIETKQSPAAFTQCMNVQLRMDRRALIFINKPNQISSLTAFHFRNIFKFLCLNNITKCTYIVHLQLPCLEEHALTRCMLCPVEICPNRLLCYCVCPQVASCQKIFYLDLAYSADCSCFFSEQKSKNPTCCFGNCQEWCSLWTLFPHSPHSLVSGAKNYFAVICS